MRKEKEKKRERAKDRKREKKKGQKYFLKKEEWGQKFIERKSIHKEKLFYCNLKFHSSP